MEKHILVVALNCSDPAREGEFNEWYNKVHIPEVLSRVPGVKSAIRYEVVEPTEGDPKYIALYEMADPKDMENYLIKKERGEVPPFTAGPPLEMVWHVNLKLLKSDF